LSATSGCIVPPGLIFPCAVCHAMGKWKRCGNCAKERYCGRDCQVLGWKEHKKECKPAWRCAKQKHLPFQSPCKVQASVKLCRSTFCFAYCEKFKPAWKTANMPALFGHCVEYKPAWSRAQVPAFSLTVCLVRAVVVMNCCCTVFNIGCIPNNLVGCALLLHGAGPSSICRLGAFLRQRQRPFVECLLFCDKSLFHSTRSFTQQWNRVHFSNLSNSRGPTHFVDSCLLPLLL
jgi:hypothetical protein